MSARTTRAASVVAAVGAVAALAAPVGLTTLAAPPTQASATSVAEPRPSSQARPQTPARGTAAITGTVTDAASGRPVAGALVTLHDGSPPRAADGWRGPQRTDPRGRFAFLDLPASDSYRLSAAAIGFLDTDNIPDTPPLVVAEGQWLPDVTVALTPAGSIAGLVLDEAGEPVVGAYVRVLSRVAVAGASYLAAGPIVRTDDRGAYSIGPLDPGTYYVMVPSVQASVPGTMDAFAIAGQTAGSAARASRGAAPPPPVERTLDPDPRARLVIGEYGAPPPQPAAAYPLAFHPAGADLASATAIDLGPGEAREGADVHLAPVPAVTVAGRLDGATPDALIGLTLRLVPEALADLGAGSEAATARVAPDGAFVFLGVPAGRYVLSAPSLLAEYQTYSMLRSIRLPGPPGRGSSGFSSRSVPAAPPGTSFSVTSGGYWSPRTCQWARTTIDVGRTDLENVHLAMRECATISGRIGIDAEPGGSETPSASQFNLSAQAADGSPALGLPRQGPNRDEPQDAFEIGGLLPGAFLLQASAQGQWLVKSIMYEGRDYTDAPFETTTGGDITGVVVTFTSRAATIEGRVATGAPAGAATSAVAAVTVVVFPVDRRGWTNYGREPVRIRSTPAASDGRFVVDRLPAGEYFVAAVSHAAPGVWQSPGFFALAAPRAERVSVDWGGRATASPRPFEVGR